MKKTLRFIKAHYDGIVQKWEIHAKEIKSVQLSQILQKFINDPIFHSSDEPFGQFDIQFRMLSLIYNLSQSDNVNVSPFGSDEDTESKNPYNGAFYRETPSILDELSLWSEDTSQESLEDLPLDKDLKSQKAPLPVLQKPGLPVDFSSISKEIQPRYWELSSLGYSRFPKSFLAKHEQMCEKIGIRRNLVIVVTEYQVIREILWMFRRPTKGDGSLVFRARREKDKFSVNPNVSLPSLAKDSLTRALKMYTSCLDDIFLLQEFLSRNDDDIPHTYEAYGDHLMIFLGRFSSALIKIEEKTQVHIRGICDGENWFKSIKLISVLNDSICHVFKQNEYEIGVEGLLRTLRPYLRIADSWISQGRLEDWRNEFIYTANPNLKGKDQNIWEDAFIMQNTHQCTISSSLYNEFLCKLKETLIPLKERPSEKDHDIKESECQRQHFKEVEEIANHTENVIEEFFESKNDYLLKGYELNTLRSFEPCIFAALDPILEKYYSSACERMLSFFKNDLKLESHLSAIRMVFLMEAGDMLQEFYVEIFNKMQERDSLFFDTSNLTLHLQGCLSFRSFEIPPERFSINLSKNDKTGDILDQIHMHYIIDCPLNIVITTHHIELVITPENICSKDSWKRRKILLLRAWLFHFVGSIHSYFMTRVLHSTELELKNRLNGCKDLDDIIRIHADYIALIVDRCFLHSNGSILRNTVLKVLNICTTLKELVLSDETEDLSALENLEEVYSRSHQFLATTLRSIVQKRNLPHLESLAVALIYSCPEKNMNLTLAFILL
ncbi:TUBGCP5 [Lepeophtheirus salmonis]|uniref:Gamma-tubulin complex component n=1 Tax=Lepeophtheirus salmonis TaxID=72036 RepID=A0A7R8D4V7_LEPSM|nr:TUBGCP5 [Lepeophtheirus salmonis]CAF3029411.1 TUBGCP5 [Lepeophtheirus salmonis]